MSEWTYPPNYSTKGDRVTPKYAWCRWTWRTWLVFRDKLRPVVGDQLFWPPIGCKSLSQHCHRLGSCSSGHFYHLWWFGTGVHGYEEYSSFEWTCKIKVHFGPWSGRPQPGVQRSPWVRFAPSDVEYTLLLLALAHCPDLATISSFMAILSCVQFSGDPHATSPECIVVVLPHSTEPAFRVNFHCWSQNGFRAPGTCSGQPDCMYLMTLDDMGSSWVVRCSWAHNTGRAWVYTPVKMLAIERPWSRSHVGYVHRKQNGWSAGENSLFLSLNFWERRNHKNGCQKLTA